MSTYPFHIIDSTLDGPSGNPEMLANRPCERHRWSFESDAARFRPSKDLTLAMNTAIAVGQPLLLTGEPGTGKTQAAYYAAYKLRLGAVLHFQVKSTTAARDLLYSFDTVGFFSKASVDPTVVDRRNNFIAKGALWRAFESPTPRVVLIDELDKAPRDFPNDLLLELDRMTFTVDDDGRRTITAKTRPIVFITSNAERRLPRPFLRRCCYHNITFEEKIAEQALEAHRDDFADLDDAVLESAKAHFFALRENREEQGLPTPTTSELLTWLRALASRRGFSREDFGDSEVDHVPLPSVLIKDMQDRRTQY